MTTYAGEVSNRRERYTSSGRLLMMFELIQAAPEPTVTMIAFPDEADFYRPLIQDGLIAEVFGESGFDPRTKAPLVKVEIVNGPPILAVDKTGVTFQKLNRWYPPGLPEEFQRYWDDAEREAAGVHRDLERMARQLGLEMQCGCCGDPVPGSSTESGPHWCDAPSCREWHWFAVDICSPCIIQLDIDLCGHAGLL